MSKSKLYCSMTSHIGWWLVRGQTRFFHQRLTKESFPKERRKEKRFPWLGKIWPETKTTRFSHRNLPESMPDRQTNVVLLLSGIFCGFSKTRFLLLIYSVEVLGGERGPPISVNNWFVWLLNQLKIFVPKIGLKIMYSSGLFFSQFQFILQNLLIFHNSHLSPFSSFLQCWSTWNADHFFCHNSTECFLPFQGVDPLLVAVRLMTFPRKLGQRKCTWLGHSGEHPTHLLETKKKQYLIDFLHF